MLKLSNQNIKVLHLEPTTNCNAECPQCLRTYSKFTPAELKLEDIKKLFTIEFIQNLDKMFMCGNLGDPAAAAETIEIFKYFREINPSIILGLNTNGGLRSTSWWANLATVLSLPYDYVVFSIDGLEDTNHIYRKNVNWKKVMQNASSFINAGGSAHWDMLVFEHNEHQINQAQELAKQLNFSWFRAKVSKRHKTVPVSWLHPPLNWVDPIVTNGQIECYAIKEHSVFVNALGDFYPCCWLKLDSEKLENFDEIIQTWNTDNQNKTCGSICSKNSLGTSFTNQWQQEIDLKKFNSSFI